MRQKAPWNRSGPSQLESGEVLKWFEEAGIKRLPLPTEADIQPIVDAINRRRWSPPPLDEASRENLKNFSEMLSLQTQAGAKLGAAHKLLSKALLLADEVQGLEHFTDHLPEWRALYSVLEAFLKRYPPRKPGGGGLAIWQNSAPEWAKLVASCLMAAGWARASATNDGGAVPHVVSRMIEKVYPEKVTAETVARYLRSPKGRQAIRELESE